jgi:septum formation protein
MRTLTQDEIRSYVLADRPLWSAGSFHAEGAGLHVIERIETDDINGLYGLPVLKLLSILRDLGKLPALLID